ncbi:MAG: PKD domain-containing protein, partial [Candidatus Diapherotrites archaeon]|nr:PKD domain-containing protein [Candidatus Diapherotrites archaeon]
MKKIMYAILNILICAILVSSTVSAAFASWNSNHYRAKAVAMPINSHKPVNTVYVPHVTPLKQAYKPVAKTIEQATPPPMSDKDPQFNEPSHIIPVTVSGGTQPIVMSPTGNQRSVLAIGTANGFVYVYDKPELTRVLFQGDIHQGQPVQAIALDDNYMYTGGFDGTIRKFAINNNFNEQVLYSGTSAIYSIALDSNNIYFGDSDGKLHKISKTGSNHQVVQAFTDYSGNYETWDNVYDVLVDGSYVYVAGGEGKVKRYTVGLSYVDEPYSAVGDKIYSIAKSGDTLYIADSHLIYQDGSAVDAEGRIIRISNGNTHQINANTKRIYNIEISNGKLYITAQEGITKIWNALPPVENQETTLTGPTGNNDGFAIDTDYFYVGSYSDGTLIARNASDNSDYKTLSGFGSITTLATHDTINDVNDAPEITNIDISPNPVDEGNQVTITVMASDPDGTIVQYDVDFGDGTQETQTSNVFTHTYATAGTYTITATVTDNGDMSGNNVKTDTDTAQVVVDDVTPPTISNVNVNVGPNSATITWDTDEPANGTIEYGTTTNYGSSVSHTDFVTSHSVTISGLSGDTAYHFKIEVYDQSGNYNETTDDTFKTIDVDAPDISIDSPADGSSFAVENVTVYYHSTATDLDHYEVSTDNTNWITDTDGSPYTFTGLPDGQNTLYVKAVDDDGLEATASI